MNTVVGATVTVTGSMSGSLGWSVNFKQSANGSFNGSQSVGWSIQTAGVLLVSVTTPPPALSGISPSSATAGGNAFTLTVFGSNFHTGSKVHWNGTALSTTYISANGLTASVPASLIARPGLANVTVFNPQSGITTAPMLFTINKPPHHGRPPGGGVVGSPGGGTQAP